MPRPFPQLDELEFSEFLLQFDFTRHINMVHVHHTWRPNHAQYRGYASIESMWRHHTQVNGWRDIAQHVSIGPEGAIWLGRNFNLPPASAAGHNGTEEFGPFMIEIIGDFDAGQDELIEPQRRALAYVIAAIHKRFDLSHSALMFHNMMSPKSCPGTSLAFNELLNDVNSLRGDSVISRNLERLTQEKQQRVTDALAHQTREIPAPRGDESLAEHEPHGEFTLQRQERGGFEIASGLTTEMIGTLRPHVINLRGGKFSTDGKMTSATADVDALVNDHLEAALASAKAQQRPLRIVLYAHGGLVSESSGLKRAYSHLAWWKANNIYPINFVWETGLSETVIDLLKKASGQGRRAFGIDKVTDFLIEKALRALGMDTIWRGMKSAAEAASARDGGALYSIRKLKDFCAQHGDDVELHAVGHSAGSIFHAYLLATSNRLGLPAFKTLQLLAPAARVDLFKSHLMPLIGEENGIDKLTMFTMSRHFELDDHVAHAYRKSLLYLVSASAENEVDAPILGLEESLRADSDTATLFGLTTSTGRATIHWSVSGTTASTSHGGFDDDPATLASVVRNVLDLNETDEVVPYPPDGQGASSSGARGDIDWPESFYADDPPRLAGNWADSPQRSLASRGLRGRHALCIGIDKYPRKALNGCVADARAWGAWLETQDFDVSYLLDRQATAAAIRDGIDTVLSKAVSGDVVVIQFAGHGTQIADTSNDEEDQLDEALVPIDFLEGEFVIDDTLGELFDRHRDRGLELVFFTDCCHSGSNARAAFDVSAAANQHNSRFLRVEQELQSKYSRKHPGVARSTSRRDALGWEVHFAACQDQQSAYEENGHGKFTVAMLNILSQAANESLTYGKLADGVIRTFVNDTQQTPNFRAMTNRRSWHLFSGQAAIPAADATDRMQSSAEMVASAASTKRPSEQSMARIERRLDELSSLIRSRVN